MSHNEVNANKANQDLMSSELDALNSLLDSQEQISSDSENPSYVESEDLIKIPSENAIPLPDLGIGVSQEKLEEIKKQLQNILESLSKNQSYLSRAASFWGPLPRWKKLLFGVAISSPSVAVGLVTNVASLFALTGFTLFTYLGGGAALDDHHHHSQDSINKIKESVTSLATILEVLILALEDIRRNFKEEVEKFKVENIRFKSSLTQFMQQSRILFSQVESLTATDVSLKQRREELEAIIENFKGFSEEDLRQLDEYKNELLNVAHNYKENQLELDKTKTDLNLVEKNLKEQVDKGEKLNEALQGVINTLINLNVRDSAQREQVQKRLNDFLANKEASFHSIAERICKSEELLSLQNEKYASLNEKYSNLLSNNEMVVESYKILLGVTEEKFDQLKQSNMEQKEEASAVSLPTSPFGFYSKSKYFPNKPVSTAPQTPCNGDEYDELDSPEYDKNPTMKLG